MMYLLILLILFLYLYVLFKHNSDKRKYLDNKLIIALSITLSIFLIYVFSLSFDLSNTDEYKKIHSKNLSIRSNIKTIRENIPILEFNLSQKPDDFNGWLMLGKSYSILNQYQKASRAYQVAIDLSPDNTDAIREFILVLRSDSEIINQELIKKYFDIYFNKTNDHRALLDMLNFSFSINDNSLAQLTLERILKHPNIKNPEQYKEILTQLKNNVISENVILNLNITTNKIYNGFFFIILKESNIDQPFATKRFQADKREHKVIFTSRDFMINNTDIPNSFDLVIKHSVGEKFSDNNRPVTVFEKKINNYEEIKTSIIRVNF